MFKNYLKIAFRNLFRQKAYATINITGLALGIAIAVLVILLARFKLSYDRHLPDAHNIYRVIQPRVASAPPGLAAALERNYPEFEKLTVVLWPERRLISTRPEESFYADEVITADAHFLEIFRYTVLAGNPRTMLSRPGQMVVTRSLAERIFGAETPLGRMITVDDEKVYEITGVVEDVPLNSHFRFQGILSLDENQRRERDVDKVEWGFHLGGYIYALLHTEIDPKQLQAKLSEWAKRSYPHNAAQSGLLLQPLTEIHLHSDLGNEIAPQSDIRYLYFFMLLALVVLAVGCMNHINLATASGIPRYGEIAMRKVLGATRRQLIFQFLAASTLLSAFALPPALAIVELAIPQINRWFGELMIPGMSYDLRTIGFLAILVLLTGAAAGAYPAFFLSGWTTARGLKRMLPIFERGDRLRRVLIILQFATAAFFITTAVVLKLQLDFLLSKPLGFEKDAVITYPAEILGEKYQAFKQTLLQSPHIFAVSSGPAAGVGQINMSTIISSPVSGENARLNTLRVDHDYFRAFDLRLKAGRCFSESFPAGESAGVILNESAARLLGIAEDPIGKIFEIDNKSWRIIGVIEDYNHHPLRKPITPMAFLLSPGHNWSGIVRLNPQNIAAAISDIQRAWKQFAPAWPFEYTFLSERIARRYRFESRAASIFTFFSGFAILISVLGLFGMAALATGQRAKEIGIRKVLGATVANVTALLSKDFLKLVLLAECLAFPVAWLALRTVLQYYAYRITISVWVFIAIGVALFFVAMASVSTQAIRVALANPVEALRYE